MQANLLRAIRFGIFAILLTPLLNWNALFFSFAVTKGFFIIAVIEGLTVLYLWLLAVDSSWRPRLGAIGKTFLAYVAIVLLTSIIGVDPAFSFWGDADRVTGGLMWVHLAALFTIASGVLRTPQDWQRMFRFCVGVALAVVLIDFAFRLGLVEFARLGSTIGNSSAYAVYLLFNVFITAYLALASTRRWERLVGWVAMPVFAIAIFNTDAHAVSLSLVGSMILLAGLLAIQRARRRCHRLAGWSIVAALVIVTLVVVALSFRPQSAVQQYVVDISSGSRFIVWDIAWQGIRERPLFGWGLENFPAVFQSHYNPCFGSDFCGGDTWYDRAHNKVLDVWVESGAVGLAAYLSIFATAIVGLWRRRGRDLAAPIFTALLAGYFVQNLTSLDVEVTLLFFVLILAYLQSTVGGISEHTHRVLPKVLPILAVVLLPFTLFHFVIQPVRGAYALVETQQTAQFATRAEAFERAVTVSPFGIDMRRLYVSAMSIQWLWFTEDEPTPQLMAAQQQEMARVERALQLTLDERPKDLRALIELAMLHHVRGRLTDPQSYAVAEKLLQQAIDFYPRHQAPLWAMASVYLEDGKTEEAIVLTRKAIALDPLVSQSLYIDLIARKFVESPEAIKARAADIVAQFPSRAQSIQVVVDADLEKYRTALLYPFYPRYR